jgi:hypothetical protein
VSDAVPAAAVAVPAASAPADEAAIVAADDSDVIR